jgi:DNA-binding transcriptional MerR regulator
VTPGLHRDIRRLELIRHAKDRGASWAVIGATLGMTGREAKRHAHKLETQARRATLRP